MKEFKKSLLSIVMIISLFVVPKVAYAANSSASNWRIFCEKTAMAANEETKCYLIAQITDATDGGKAITAVLSNIQTGNMEIANAAPAFNYIQVDTTIASATFKNTLHGNKTTCDSKGNCYDFTSSQGIVSNANDSNITGRGYTGYTPIGYWTVKFVNNQSNITNGSVCASAEYVVDGKSSNASFANDGSCVEIRLEEGTYPACYCNSASNKCYGKDGSEVSREVYESECNPKCDAGQLSDEELKKYCTCVQENGKFFGKDSTQVTEEQFKIECGKKCYQSNGKYYGKDGNEVSKEQYERDCLPKTGSFASYAVLAAGALIALSAITIAKKHNRFYKV